MREHLVNVIYESSEVDDRSFVRDIKKRMLQHEEREEIGPAGPLSDLSRNCDDGGAEFV